MNSKLFSSPVFRFIGTYLGVFVLFYVLLAGFRSLVCTGAIDLMKHAGYIAMAALTFLVTLKLWRFDKKVLLTYGVCWALYALVLILKLLDDLTVLDREIVHTICLCTFLVGLSFTLLYCAKIAKLRLLEALAALLFIFCLLNPLIMIGFFVMSGGHVLSTDLIMTLFQTNLPEIRAYLADQNLYLWGGVVLVIFLCVCSSLNLLWRVAKANLLFPKHWVYAVLIGLLWVYICVFNIFHMTFCFVLSYPYSIYKSLESFKKYEQTQEERAARLADLKNLLSENKQKGVYVVVIGESTNRDHMHAFGYERENTPWLDEMAKSPLTLLYPHAYSGHSLTVQSLQYALTEQNQYQDIPLNEAYSITEVANAAGYDTYWISNQRRFVRNDIPIITVASATNHRIWLNEHAGSKNVTTYYDEKLAEYIPTTLTNDKALLMIHLMGCHSVYDERYSSDFDVFHGQNYDKDSYDNAILHNDYVLQKLYEKAQKLPHFMAFIYFSDHGEELKDKARHDPSKFSFNMTHIPLVMIFSEEFKAEHPDIFAELAAHQDSYVTSDLLYNALLGMMGVHDLPYQDLGLDLTSKQYRMNKDNLLTLYGKKRLADDL